MKTFSIFQLLTKLRDSRFQFFPSTTLPSEYPITTPFTFPFIGKDVVLCFDKNDQWNPLGGHIEANETYQDTIIRESMEEGGVAVSRSSIQVAGYILNTNLKNPQLSKYPSPNILPITYSFINDCKTNWIPQETKKRGIFRRKSALELMKIRHDSNQMFEILEYIYELYDSQQYQTTFTYYPNKIFRNVPVTQVFTFCKNANNHFCLVRDADEQFFSLPGGSCELGENPIDCLNRELLEEAQVTSKKPILLGSILVELKRDNVTVNKFQQLRFLTDLNLISNFIPQKNGFETIERKFCPLSELISQVMILQNPNGEILVNQVKSLL